MSKNKRAIGLTLMGAMALSSLAGAFGAVNDVKTVSASTTEVEAIKAKMNHITYSLRNNYLGLKNVNQWKKYIIEAKELNGKLQNGETKEEYAKEIEKAEALIKAADHINNMEKSMASNASIMNNIPVWQQYINNSKIYLEKVNKEVFSTQYNNLLERLGHCTEEVNKVKEDFNNSLKAVETLYSEAEKLSILEKEKALDKLNEAKEAAEKLNSDKLKDDMLKKIEKLYNSISEELTPSESEAE